MSNQDNPLLEGLASELPLFDQIEPKHVLPALDHVLESNQKALDMLTQVSHPDWGNFMAPLEQLDEQLQRVWGPVTHLNAVKNSDELRPVYQESVQKVSAYHTDLAQNEALYAAIKQVRSDKFFSTLSDEQRQVIDHALRDFRLSGAELKGADKERYKAIQMRLSELATTFEQHVLDATRSFELHITEESDLAGLPDSIRDGAAQRATESDKYDSGWLFTLDIPSYLPFMQYAENRELRERMYNAYVTRASEGELDNAPVIDETLKLRREAAAMIGFDDYGSYSLATKMAESTAEVISFLRELARKSRKMAESEMAELKAFTKANLGIDALQAWDVPFASEKLRLHTYAISDEELKPYFPEQKVLNGMFALVERLYGIDIREENAPKWQKNVHFFAIYGKNSEKIAGFYLDPYARTHKRGGAWMDECTVRFHKENGALQLPVAYLVCNFDAPVGDKPALWTHNEVLTLFHEFGHGLHHMLTEVSTRSVSGINGVPWDGVELPSQFMENFCWEREVVDLFARHFETDEPLPHALFSKMLAAKNFQSGMQMLRQIEFSLFDMLLHTEFLPEGDRSVQQLLDEVREEVAVLTPPAFNKFQNSFSHIFAGGYGAGYYSYKWAEVLSADAYAAFEEEGITNPVTATRFRESILAIGGSRDLMEGFEAFRGRKPSVDALLRHSGIQ
ncbi:MAG TPA: M3 family metallopeptidase [Mariprofundaceae bacterium]|nr:M3 family metallopeptidase [Mariprofundaceae bacterium]